MRYLKNGFASQFSAKSRPQKLALSKPLADPVQFLLLKKADPDQNKKRLGIRF